MGASSAKRRETQKEKKGIEACKSSEENKREVVEKEKKICAKATRKGGLREKRRPCLDKLQLASHD
jgi:hypothetical protein